MVWIAVETLFTSDSGDIVSGKWVLDFRDANQAKQFQADYNVSSSSFESFLDIQKKTLGLKNYYMKQTKARMLKNEPITEDVYTTVYLYGELNLQTNTKHKAFTWKFVEAIVYFENLKTGLEHQVNIFVEVRTKQDMLHLLKNVKNGHPYDNFVQDLLNLFSETEQENLVFKRYALAKVDPNIPFEGSNHLVYQRYNDENEDVRDKPAYYLLEVIHYSVRDKKEKLTEFQIQYKHRNHCYFDIQTNWYFLLTYIQKTFYPGLSIDALKLGKYVPIVVDSKLKRRIVNSDAYLFEHDFIVSISQTINAKTFVHGDLFNMKFQNHELYLLLKQSDSIWNNVLMNAYNQVKPDNKFELQSMTDIVIMDPADKLDRKRKPLIIMDDFVSMDVIKTLWKSQIRKNKGLALLKQRSIDKVPEIKPEPAPKAPYEQVDTAKPVKHEISTDADQFVSQIKIKGTENAPTLIVESKPKEKDIRQIIQELFRDVQPVEVLKTDAPINKLQQKAQESPTLKTLKGSFAKTVGKKPENPKKLQHLKKKTEEAEQGSDDDQIESEPRVYGSKRRIESDDEEEQDNTTSEPGVYGSKKRIASDEQEKEEDDDAESLFGSEQEERDEIQDDEEEDIDNEENDENRPFYKDDEDEDEEEEITDEEESNANSTGKKKIKDKTKYVFEEGETEESEGVIIQYLTDENLRDMNFNFDQTDVSPFEARTLIDKTHPVKDEQYIPITISVSYTIKGLEMDDQVQTVFYSFYRTENRKLPTQQKMKKLIWRSFYTANADTLGLNIKYSQDSAELLDEDSELEYKDDPDRIHAQTIYEKQHPIQIINIFQLDEDQQREVLQSANPGYKLNTLITSSEIPNTETIMKSFLDKYCVPAELIEGQKNVFLLKTCFLTDYEDDEPESTKRTYQHLLVKLPDDTKSPQQIRDMIKIMSPLLEKTVSTLNDFDPEDNIEISLQPWNKDLYARMDLRVHTGFEQYNEEFVNYAYYQISFGLLLCLVSKKTGTVYKLPGPLFLNRIFSKVFVGGDYFITEKMKRDQKAKIEQMYAGMCFPLASVMKRFYFYLNDKVVNNNYIKELCGKHFNISTFDKINLEEDIDTTYDVFFQGNGVWIKDILRVGIPEDEQIYVIERKKKDKDHPDLITAVVKYKRGILANDVTDRNIVKSTSDVFLNGYNALVTDYTNAIPFYDLIPQKTGETKKSSAQRRREFFEKELIRVFEDELKRLDAEENARQIEKQVPAPKDSEPDAKEIKRLLDAQREKFKKEQLNAKLFDAYFDFINEMFNYAIETDDHKRISDGSTLIAYRNSQVFNGYPFDEPDTVNVKELRKERRSNRLDELARTNTEIYNKLYREPSTSENISKYMNQAINQVYKQDFTSTSKDKSRENNKANAFKKLVFLKQYDNDEASRKKLYDDIAEIFPRFDPKDVINFNEKAKKAITETSELSSKQQKELQELEQQLKTRGTKGLNKLQAAQYIAEKYQYDYHLDAYVFPENLFLQNYFADFISLMNKNDTKEAFVIRISVNKYIPSQKKVRQAVLLISIDHGLYYMSAALKNDVEQYRTCCFVMMVSHLVKKWKLKDQEAKESFFELDDFYISNLDVVHGPYTVFLKNHFKEQTGSYIKSGNDTLFKDFFNGTLSKKIAELKFTFLFDPDFLYDKGVFFICSIPSSDVQIIVYAINKTIVLRAFDTYTWLTELFGVNFYDDIVEDEDDDETEAEIAEAKKKLEELEEPQKNETDTQKKAREKNIKALKKTIQQLQDVKDSKEQDRLEQAKLSFEENREIPEVLFYDAYNESAKYAINFYDLTATLDLNEEQKKLQQQAKEELDKQKSSKIGTYSYLIEQCKELTDAEVMSFLTFAKKDYAIVRKILKFHIAKVSNTNAQIPLLFFIELALFPYNNKEILDIVNTSSNDEANKKDAQNTVVFINKNYQNLNRWLESDLYKKLAIKLTDLEKIEILSYRLNQDDVEAAFLLSLAVDRLDREALTVFGKSKQIILDDKTEEPINQNDVEATFLLSLAADGLDREAKTVFSKFKKIILYDKTKELVHPDDAEKKQQFADAVKSSPDLARMLTLVKNMGKSEPFQPLKVNEAQNYELFQQTQLALINSGDLVFDRTNLNLRTPSKVQQGKKKENINDLQSSIVKRALHYAVRTSDKDDIAFVIEGSETQKRGLEENEPEPSTKKKPKKSKIEPNNNQVPMDFTQFALNRKKDSSAPKPKFTETSKTPKKRATLTVVSTFKIIPSFEIRELQQAPNLWLQHYSLICFEDEYYWAASEEQVKYFRNHSTYQSYIKLSPEKYYDLSKNIFYKKENYKPCWVIKNQDEEPSVSTEDFEFTFGEIKSEGEIVSVIATDQSVLSKFMNETYNKFWEKLLAVCRPGRMFENAVFTKFISDAEDLTYQDNKYIDLTKAINYQELFQSPLKFTDRQHWYILDDTEVKFYKLFLVGFVTKTNERWDVALRIEQKMFDEFNLKYATEKPGNLQTDDRVADFILRSREEYLGAIQEAALFFLPEGSVTDRVLITPLTVQEFSSKLYFITL